MRTSLLIRCLSAALLWSGLLHAATPEENALLDSWCAAQNHLHTWTADAIQTREIKTFNQPLVSTGKVWVITPDRFRWELGQPAQTIALRNGGQLYLVYPKLKRAEKYALNSKQSGTLHDALVLIEATFPRSRAELDTQFKVLSITQTNGTARLALEPKSDFAKKFMTQVDIAFRLSDFTPVLTELKFSDGSRMRNEFTNSVVNQPLEDRLFEAEIGPDYKLTEPLNSK